jgi:membrane fusion protein (multidrug efflux system)
MKKRMVIMLIAVGVVLGGIFGFEEFRTVMTKKFFASRGVPVQTVSAVVASVQDWQPHIDAVGSLRAVNGADLALEVPGVVASIGFKSGDDVAVGAQLMALNAEDDVAKLHSLEATASLAQITYQRDQRQFKAQAVSQATIDADAANLKNAEAQVAEQRAVVDKKALRAPFAGHLGIRQVDLGQYLAAGTTIVTLQALDPLYVDFFLPQQSIDRIKPGQAVIAHVDTFPGVDFSGEIAAVNPKVDSGSRNVQVRALLKNPERKLLPGMYATVSINTGAIEHYVTLPQTAIAYNPYGDTVYLVAEAGKGADGKPALVVRQTFVTVGPTRGDQVAILKGVDAGANVVSAGQNKLRNGAPVAINNSVQPTDDPHPTPQEQ